MQTDTVALNSTIAHLLWHILGTLPSDTKLLLSLNLFNKISVLIRLREAGAGCSNHPTPTISSILRQAAIRRSLAFDSSRHGPRLHRTYMLPEDVNIEAALHNAPPFSRKAYQPVRSKKFLARL